MLTRLYQWMLAKAAHRHAERWLFAFSFMESSFCPIPPHPLLGLMCLARPERALRFGFICTLASVLGGLMGYAPIIPVNQTSCEAFVTRGGRIPAPIHSFKN